MNKKLKDGFDFMKDCYKKPALYGSFLTAFYADPAPTDQELSDWFKGKGYEVSASESKKIRGLMTVSQANPCLHY